MQVADMTTFLAQLLFKLTQMSNGFANAYVKSQNKLQLKIDSDPDLAKTEMNSNFPIPELNLLNFSNSDNIQFKNNSQLLTDTDLNV